MPGAASKFNIPITAEDKTAAGIRSVNKRFESLSKPLTNLDKATAKFTKGSGFGDLLGGVGKLKSVLGDTTGGMAEAAEGLGVLGGAAGAATVGVGAIAVALAVATEKTVAFAIQQAASASVIGRMAQTIGISSQQMQLWDGAAEQNGDSAEAMNAALNNVGNTLNDARFGRNNAALALLNQLGIKIPYTKDGMIDVGKATLLLSDAMTRNGPQTQQMIAGMFGLSGVLNTVRGGSTKLQAQMDATGRTGVLMTSDQIAASEAYNSKIVLLGQSWTALRQDFGQNVAIPWTTPLIDALSRAVGLMDRLLQGKENLGGLAQRHGAQINGAIAGGLAAGPVGAVLGWKAASGPGATRGERNNNPGNLRNLAGQFRRFQTMNAGVSAMTWQLQRYQNHYGLRNLQDIITRWAPPSENNTLGYITNVAKRTGFNATQDLNLSDPVVMAKLEAAMITQENGKALFTPAQLQAANTQNAALGGARLDDNGVVAPGAAAQSVIAQAAAPSARAASPDAPVTYALPSDAQALSAPPINVRGSVDVSIKVANAPAGTTVSATSSGAARVSPGVATSLSGF